MFGLDFMVLFKIKFVINILIKVYKGLLLLINISIRELETSLFSAIPFKNCNDHFFAVGKIKRLF